MMKSEIVNIVAEAAAAAKSGTKNEIQQSRGGGGGGVWGECFQQNDKAFKNFGAIWMAT
jgi:hypothetical protein